MLINIEARLAYLAMTKTGSTSVENTLRPHCQVQFTHHPGVTHMPAHHFERFLRPYLVEAGFGDVQTCAQIRHPVAWLESWWRYRSKPGDWEPEMDTSDLSFEAFAGAYVEGGDAPYLSMHRPLGFYCDAEGRLLVDYVYRCEEMALFARFLSARFGRELSVPHHNRSPRRWARLSRPMRARCEEFFAPELEIWEAKTARGAEPESRREAPQAT